MSIRDVAIFAVIGLSACAGGARGQSVAVPAARPAGSDTKTAVVASSDWQQSLDLAARELQGLIEEQTKVGQGQDSDRLQKQIELQQKQIESLMKMTKLLAEQVRKQTPTGDAVEELEERVATQEARSQQAAKRDQELAQSQDDLVDWLDAKSRDGPALPATLRELFLQTRTNESPLALYGTVAQEFRSFSQQNSTFRDRSLQLRPYLQLNEQWLMSANVALQINQVQIYRAQLERYINDNLTLVVGRFYSPIGFYNERLRMDWVIKTPDPPMMFNQVYPLLLSFDGVQLRGARYVADWPVKLEYSGFVANGLSVSGGNLSPVIYSNLNNFRDEIDDVNHSKAYGGRVGLSFPTIGLIAGISGLANGAYDSAGHDMNLWDVDASWHRGNWDARFEYANNHQQTPASPIRRKGLYTQVAYRRYNSQSPFFQKLEWVFRFDHVQFDGINLQQTGIGFGGLGNNLDRMPIDRNRYTLGVNYWFYPSLVLKLDYEIYDELGVPSLRDNGFVAQLVFGW